MYVKLFGLGTSFGQLEKIASLRDPHTGVYGHPDLMELEESEADCALRSLHENLFGRWINYGLSQQSDDLRLFLLTDPEPEPDRIIEKWRACQLHCLLPPMTAIKADRELFRLDLELLMRLIGHDHSINRANVGSIDPIIAISLKFLTNSEQHTPSLAELSSLVNLSEERARHVFNAPVGHFRTLLRHLRMRRAAYLLREGSHSITAVASEVGYTDPANFARAFKTVLMVRPHEYRDHWKHRFGHFYERWSNVD